MTIQEQMGVVVHGGICIRMKHCRGKEGRLDEA